MERRSNLKNRSGRELTELDGSCREDGVAMGSIGVLIRKIHLAIEGHI